MLIKIKRSDNDLEIGQIRPYINKLIVLCNKQHLPTLFMAVDIHKYPKSDFWHFLYKLNKDDECPYVTLRIMSQPADFSRQKVRILILDTVFAAAPHERLLALSRVKVISELTILVQKQTKQAKIENNLPFDLSLLLIKRKTNNSFDEFIIYYHGEVFDQQQLDTEKITQMYQTMSLGEDKISPFEQDMQKLSQKFPKKASLNHLSERTVDSILTNQQFKKAMQQVFKRQNTKGNLQANILMNQISQQNF